MLQFPIMRVAHARGQDHLIYFWRQESRQTLTVLRYVRTEISEPLYTVPSKTPRWGRSRRLLAVTRILCYTA